MEKLVAEPEACAAREIMTILVTFHQHHYRNFKHYYINHVSVYWADAFGKLPSYQRFIEWIAQTLMPLCVYLKHCFGHCTGISFIDSTCRGSLP